MWKSANTRGENQFTASGKKDKRFLEEKEKAWSEATERMARQRALRLAKQAADGHVAADGTAAKKRPPKPSSVQDKT